MDLYTQGTLTVTFDQTPASPGTDYLFPYGYNEQGVSFTAPLGVALVGPNTSPYPDDGTTYLQLGYGTSLQIADLNSSIFSLDSVDLAGFMTGMPPGSAITFIGYHPDGTTVTTSFTPGSAPSGVADFQTFDFGSDWSDLTYVQVPGPNTPDQGWSMDNLILTVPEPGTGALFILGGLLFQFHRRKRAAGLPQSSNRYIR